MKNKKMKPIKFNLPLKTQYMKYKKFRLYTIIISIILLIIFRQNFFLILLIVISNLLLFVVPKTQDKVKYKLFNIDNIKDKLKNMIITNNYYDSETYLDNKNKQRIRLLNYLFIYYLEDKDYVYITFDKKQTNYIDNNFKNNIENYLQTFLELTEYEKFEDNNTIDFIFNKNTDKRISYDNSITDKNGIILTENVTWNFRKEPHFLISGETGSGKTLFLQYLIKEATFLTKDIYIIDPKISKELVNLEDLYEKGNIASNDKEIARILRNLVQIMEDRNTQDLIDTKNNNNVIVENFKNKPIFCFIDEFAILSTFDKKIKEEIFNYFKKLIFQARSSNIHIVVGIQRPDTDFIDGAIREQFSVRSVVGKLGTQGYRMIFDNVDKDIDFNVKDKGEGYIFINQELREIQYPHFTEEMIKNYYSYVKEARKLGEENGN